MTSSAGTLLIHRGVETDDEAEELIIYVLESLDLDPLDPTLKVEWFESDELPPINIPVHEKDQLLAHKRDRPDSVYFTVLAESIEPDVE